jgi:hypothetical protein
MLPQPKRSQESVLQMHYQTKPKGCCASTFEHMNKRQHMDMFVNV